MCFGERAMTGPGRAVPKWGTPALPSPHHAPRPLPLQTAYVYDPFACCMVFRQAVLESLSALGSAQQLRSSSPSPPSLLAGDGGGDGESVNHRSRRTDAEEERGALPASACHCNLNLHNLFEDEARDIPRPIPALSKCELHELLRSLPPRLQNCPWRLSYDTARDGFSLRNFYRAMESVYAAEDGGLCLLFLSERRGDEADGGGSTGLTGVVGCFTPKVPCLASHGGSPHAFYGSPETYVFRLRLSGRRRDYGGFTAGSSTAPRSAANSVRGDAFHRAADASSSGKGAEGGGGGPCALQHLFVDGDASSQILPTPTRELRRRGSAVTDEGEDRPPVAEAAAAASLHCSPCASPTHVIPDVSGCFSSPHAERQREVSARLGPGAVGEEGNASGGEPLAHVPLLERYSWCGDPNKRQFVLAQSHFFAIGGGKDGAALYIGENLEHCTSSTHCETFDSPPLFGVRPSAGLRHTEAVVMRMLWFALHDDAGQRRHGRFRVMTYTDEEVMAKAEEEGGSAEEVTCCPCGRRSAAVEDASVGRARRPSHKCNDSFFAF